ASWVMFMKPPSQLADPEYVSTETTAPGIAACTWLPRLATKALNWVCRLGYVLLEEPSKSMLTPSRFLDRIDEIVQLIAFWVAFGLPTMALMVPLSKALITRTTRSFAACALLMTVTRSWLIQPLKPLLVGLVLKEPLLCTSSPK